MEPEVSLPYSPEPTTSLHPEPHESSPQPANYFLTNHLNITFPHQSRQIFLLVSFLQIIL
jgi:hypothetical protein